VMAHQHQNVNLSLQPTIHQPAVAPQHNAEQDGNGNSKYTTQNSITQKFSRLTERSGLKVPKGTGFYTLRRTAATIAARSGDPFAIQRLLGHADLKMATRYVQDVSKQTDKVINSSRDFLRKKG